MPKKKSILLLAADSGEGQFMRLADPELRKRLSRDGISLHESFISQVKTSELDLFDSILIMRTPVPGHAKGDFAVFKKLIPHLKRFVRNGGGLVMMFAECYGKTVASLNKLGKEFGIEFAFNKLTEHNESKVCTMPNMPEGKLIKCEVAPQAPFGREEKPLYVITEGGHGTQALTCLPDDNWESVLLTSPECVSEPFPEGYYAGGGKEVIQSPELCVYREFGDGRIVAFPSSSPVWIASCFLPRWEEFILKQEFGHGYEFLRDMLLWTAENGSGSVADALNIIKNRISGKGTEFSFKAVSASHRDEICSYKSYKCWIGFIPLSKTIDDIIAAAQVYKFAFLVILHNFNDLDKGKWDSLCKKYSMLGQKNGMIIMPGYEQLDGEGNYSVVFNVEELPEQRYKYPNSNLLEDLLVKLNSYTAVFARPEDNRLPVWRHGGYNQLEVSGEDGVDLYRERISSGAFLGPLHISRGQLPGEEQFFNVLLADSLENVPTALSENRHFNYISSGPVINTFFFKGDRIVEDDWEGYWLEWEEGRSAEVEISVSSEEILTSIELFNGDESLMRFKPYATYFKTVVIIPLRHDLRLHLAATDRSGARILASYPLYTRNRLFWAHMGSDQMNDYHNVFVPDPEGSMGICDQFYEPCGFVTCGFGWGDYVRITSPVPWKDIMPQGMEVSSLIGNFKSFHPSPFIKKENGFDFLNNHKRRLGNCNQNMHVVHSYSDSCWLDAAEGETWHSVSGKEFKPSRTIRRSGLWLTKAKYVIPRWNPYESSEVFANMEILWLQDHTFGADETFSLGHSMHELKPGLRFSLEDASGTLFSSRAEDFLGVDIYEEPATEKEWDNQGVVDMLTEPMEMQPIIEVRNGCTLRIGGDGMGDFIFNYLLMPGKVFVRGWRRAANQFYVSFEIMPEIKEIQAGDRMMFEFSFGVEA
jgi:hypothetical protein